MTDRLDNATARRLFLWLHGLSGETFARRRTDLPALVERLGFVQIDSIRTVERAHHHILLSRCSGYRPGWLAHHVGKDRALFENWTHDASVIPVQFFPYWKPRFQRAHHAIMNRAWWRERIGDNPVETCRRVLDHIAEHGPVMARDLKAGNPEPPPGQVSKTAWWGWHPSKAALVFLWRTGKLAICGREGFQKVYDLTERVIPEQYRSVEPTEAVFLDWTCSGAIERLGFASHGEIAAFWDALRPAEVQSWLDGPGRKAVRPLDVVGADGTSRTIYARPDIAQLLREVPEPPARIRFLSPFDPVTRDRKRAEWLFGFEFRIEIYVPRARRTYGYYVYPMLERDRFVGRIEMKANETADALDVLGLWLEPGMRLTKGRRARIDAELDRWRRYRGLGRINWMTAGS